VAGTTFLIHRTLLIVEPVWSARLTATDAEHLASRREDDARGTQCIGCVLLDLLGRVLGASGAREPAEPDDQQDTDEDGATMLMVSHRRLPPVKWAPYQVVVMVVVIPLAPEPPPSSRIG
jgi:hypothetical protein